MTKRVALYTRVSTEDQAKEGFSLDAQLRKLVSFAEIHGWSVVGTYTDDGKSARSIKRRGYQAMMADIDRWDGVLVLKMDRIHRNSLNFAAMMQKLSDAAKSFVSVMETFDTGTAIGRFAADMIQRVAQLESEQIGERVLDGMCEKAEQRDGTMQIPGFGLKVKNGRYIPDPPNLKHVQLIFELFVNHQLTTSQIAAVLTRRGVPRKRSKKPWDSALVRVVLLNLQLVGINDWNGFMDVRPKRAVLDIQLFRRASELIAKRGERLHKSKGGADWLRARKQALDYVESGISTLVTYGDVH